MLERHTGLKQVPGFWHYGLGALQRFCVDRIGNNSSRWLRAPATVLSSLMHGMTALGIMMILRNAQGFYLDHWASDCLKWMLPEGCGDVIVCGTVPDNPGLAGQRLAVKVAGGTVDNWPIGPGDFEVRFHAPFVRPCPLLFELHSSHYVRPALGSEVSKRRMAFILKSIDWAHGCGMTAHKA